MTQLTAAARRTIASNKVGKAAALQQLARELSDARLTLLEEIDRREAGQEQALLESTEAYDLNARAIAVAEEHIKQLDALLKVVGAAQAQAGEVEFDEEIRAQGVHVRGLLTAAIAQLPQYEKLAKTIAEMLRSHVAVFDGMVDFSRSLRGPVRDGRRDEAWQESMRGRCLGPEEDVQALGLIGGVPLHEKVQLPSCRQLDPHWGNQRGEIRESMIEREARLAKEAPPSPPEEPSGHSGQVTVIPAAGRAHW